MPAEAIRINRRVLLQCSIGAPGLKQPFAQPQQNGALSAFQTSTQTAANDRNPPSLPLAFAVAAKTEHARRRCERSAILPLHLHPSNRLHTGGRLGTFCWVSNTSVVMSAARILPDKEYLL